jgi:hypothetical protein
MIDVLNRSSGQSRSTSSKWPAAESLPPTVDQTELARWVLGMSAPGDDRTGD